MQIALFKGISPVSRAIRFVTRSDYSHAAFRFDEDAVAAYLKVNYLDGNHAVAATKKFTQVVVGAVVEAWQGGVKNSSSISSLHTPGTVVDVFEFEKSLTPAEEKELVIAVGDNIGLPYDYMDVLRFLTRRRGHPGNSRFCSMLVAMCCAGAGRPLFYRTQWWMVPPDWIGRTLGLRFVRSLVT